MKNNQSHKTVSRILDAATRNFAKHGYDGARMDTIAHDANVNKATIYYHLGGKKKLYTAVLHAVFSEQAAIMADQMASTKTATEKLRVIFKTLHRQIFESPHINAIMMHEVASGGRNFPAVLSDDFTKIIGLTADALQEGRRVGLFKAPHPMVIYLMAITPLVYYEKIYTGLRKPLVSGSKIHNEPVLSLQEFGEQLETFILDALIERDTP